MEISWLDELKQLVEKKPLVILRFKEDEWYSLSDSFHGINEFTIVRSHEAFQGIVKGTPCLVLGSGPNGGNLYLGIISSRAAVATIQTRIKIQRGVAIQPGSISGLLKLVTNRRHASRLKSILSNESETVISSSKLSSHLIDILASIKSNHGPMRAVAASLSAPKYYSNANGLQEDALITALKAFGLAPGDRADSLELSQGRETGLARINILEDSVIEHDARTIQGFDLVGSDLTGRAVFNKGDEQLIVYTANRRPLEHIFGVDLIYLNLSKNNIVMLQYKMLEPFEDPDVGHDWLYRPDANLGNEIDRMRQFSANLPSSPHEYRLNPAVYYLKFVKRNGYINKGGIIIPIDHFEKLIASPICKGPKGGIRVSYNTLDGRYIREDPFLNLVRSGYIGAYADTTKQLKVLIEAVINADKAVVAAIQQKVGTK